MDPVLQSAWVAVVGTLLGTATGGAMQVLSARRSTAAAREDSAAQREMTRKLLDSQLREERFQRLWQERRSLFSRILAEADRWRQANQELRGVDLPGGLGATTMTASTMAEARRLAPEAADAVDRMNEFDLLVEEVHLLSDSEVRGAVLHLQEVLRDDMKRAVMAAGSDAAELGRAKGLAAAAMRNELIGHSP